MFYRVDYMLAVQLAGLLVGLALSRSMAGTAPHRVGRRYYVLVAIVLVVRSCAALGAIFFGGKPWSMASGIAGDLLGFLFGAIFGLAALRSDARDVLVDPSVIDALRMVLSFTFALAAIGKALTMQPMTEFFTQSGYPVVFLQFIISAELFGAIGLLLPWAMWPALAGLSVDMFGAVVTHMHNGDPLNDSTGAIALLIKMAALAVLWGLRPRPATRSVRTALAIATAVLAACLIVAVGGGVAVRHAAPAGIPTGSR